MAGETAETAAAVAEWEAELERPRQLGLPVVAPVAEPAEAEPRRGPGRPAGSRNKARQEFRTWILSRYPSPLEALAAVASMSTADLARELKRQAAECGVAAGLGEDGLVGLLKLQVQAAKELAPYLHGKVTPDQADGGKGLVNLQIVMAPEMAQRAGGADFALDVEMLENQSLSEPSKSELDSDSG